MRFSYQLAVNTSVRQFEDYANPLPIGLHVQRLFGDSQLIWKAPHADYGSYKDMSKTAAQIDETVTSGADCGLWISENQLVFHRFTGAFPESRQMWTGRRILRPDTATLVNLEDEGRFSMIDLPNGLSVDGACPDSSLVFFKKKRQGYSDDLLVVSHRFSSFASMNLRSLYCDCCGAIGFLPTGCSPFTFSGCFDEKQLIIIDSSRLPESFSDGIEAGPALLHFSRPIEQVLSDSEGSHIAFAAQYWNQSSPELPFEGVFILDLEAGVVSKIVADAIRGLPDPRYVEGGLGGVQLLAWRSN